jgi:hypothetical protein
LAVAAGLSTEGARHGSKGQRPWLDGPPACFKG